MTGAAQSHIALRDFARVVIREHALTRSPNAAVRIGVDECANHPAVWQVTSELLRQGRAELVQPLWSQLRTRLDGTHIQFTGNTRTLPSLVPDDVLASRPVRGWSVPDWQIATMLVGQFVGTDRVVLLSADKRHDRKGLRNLLASKVRPVLDAQHGDRFSLLALFKDSESTVEDYAQAVLQIMLSHPFPPGFEERVI